MQCSSVNNLDSSTLELSYSKLNEFITKFMLSLDIIYTQEGDVAVVCAYVNAFSLVTINVLKNSLS